jgi:hypothetical protein
VECPFDKPWHERRIQSAYACYALGPIALDLTLDPRLHSVNMFVRYRHPNHPDNRHKQEGRDCSHRPHDPIIVCLKAESHGTNEETIAGEGDQSYGNCEKVGKSVSLPVKRMTLNRLTGSNPHQDDFGLSLVQLPLVYESLDLFEDNEAFLAAPEEVSVPRRTVGAQFLAAGELPFGCDAARMCVTEATLRDEELHEEFADLFGGCCLAGQSDGCL